MEKNNELLLKFNPGLGDFINHIGAIRYFRTIYDKVYVVCAQPHYKPQFIECVKDDENIIIINSVLDVDRNIVNYRGSGNDCPLFYSNREEYLKYYYHNSSFPDIFYWGMQIDPKIRIDWFKIPKVQKSIDFYNKVKDYKLIFVHDFVPYDKTLFREYLKNKYPDHLIINPLYNMYDKDEKHYETIKNLNIIPSKFHISHYVDIMEHTDKFYVVDSSFSCLAPLVNKTSDIFLYPRKYCPGIVSYLNNYQGNDIQMNYDKYVQDHPNITICKYNDFSTWG